jgi:hypothetical protein
VGDRRVISCGRGLGRIPYGRGLAGDRAVISCEEHRGAQGVISCEKDLMGSSPVVELQIPNTWHTTRQLVTSM